MRKRFLNPPPVKVAQRAPAAVLPARVPLPVLLLALAGGLMLVPAAMALTGGEGRLAGAFARPSLLVLVLALFLALATRGPRGGRAQGHLRGLALAYVALPPVLALPLPGAVPGLGWGAAWFEMVSALTTTGATVLDATVVPGPVHLWRGLVGWAGGFLVLVGAAVLANLNLGGFELYAPRAAGHPTKGERDPARLLAGQALALLWAYAGLTGALWLGLRIAGDPGLVALMHAMAALSTSGITPLAGLGAAPSGLWGEALLVLGLLPALSRWLLPVARIGRPGPLLRDPELRLAAACIALVTAVLFAHHWLGAPPGGDALRALWGAGFTALSFLTTNGLASQHWGTALDWSGIGAPGMILMGLAIIGGGVATTAGGVTLLRVHALILLARREMERLSDPASVGGGGGQARQMRAEGAYIAFVFFMVFALTLGAANLALAALGLPFEQALVFSVSALSTAGPLAEATGMVPLGWRDLGGAERAVLGAVMTLGRLETLVLIALLLPIAWRR